MLVMSASQFHGPHPKRMEGQYLSISSTNLNANTLKKIDASYFSCRDDLYCFLSQLTPPSFANLISSPSSRPYPTVCHFPRILRLHPFPQLSTLFPFQNTLRNNPISYFPTHLVWDLKHSLKRTIIHVLRLPWARGHSPEQRCSTTCSPRRTEL